MSTQPLPDLVPQHLRRLWSEEGIYPGAAVFDLFLGKAAVQPDQPAVFDDDGVTNYSQLREKALRLAAGLRGLGVRAGEVVACQLPNSALACAVELATAALGATVLPFPTGRGHRDVLSLLRRSGAVVTVIPARYGDVDLAATMAELRPELPHLRHVVVHGAEAPTTVDELLATEPADLDDLPSPDPDTAVRYLVSSGTESEPKIVAYSHNALIGGRGQFLKRLQRPGRPMRAMFLIPLGSSFGSCCTFGVLCALGGSLVLQRKFDPVQALRAIGEHRPTHLAGVPTMFQRMIGSPEFAGTDTSSLQALITGGSLIDPQTVDRCVADFGCTLINLYGSADGVNCHNGLDDPPHAAKTTVGVPNPSVCSIRIVDDSGADLPPGEVGEVLARGPMSPMCYVNAPELNERYRTPDGWARTGDLGVIDPVGRLRLSGRKRDIIIRGGSNISPAQVEGVIAAHPSVLSVACVPVPCPDLGQRIAACLVAVPGAAVPDVAELAEFLRVQGLEPRKFPEVLLEMDAFPSRRRARSTSARSRSRPPRCSRPPAATSRPGSEGGEP
ncbi:class I adenylate-forming enzyme family protein [Saccharopolyspora spinosporotrichia]